MTPSSVFVNERSFILFCAKSEKRPLVVRISETRKEIKNKTKLN